VFGNSARALLLRRALHRLRRSRRIRQSRPSRRPIRRWDRPILPRHYPRHRRPSLELDIVLTIPPFNAGTRPYAVVVPPRPLLPRAPAISSLAIVPSNSLPCVPMRRTANVVAISMAAIGTVVVGSVSRRRVSRPISP